VLESNQCLRRMAARSRRYIYCFLRRSSGSIPSSGSSSSSEMLSQVCYPITYCHSAYKSLQITRTASRCSPRIKMPTRTCHTDRCSSPSLAGPYTSHNVHPLSILRALESQDEFILLKASQILTVLLRYPA